MYTTTGIFFLLLTLLTLGLYFIPFIPAIREVILKTDAEPFNVVFDDATLFDYFVRLFTMYVQKNFTKVVREHMHAEENHQGVDAAGETYQFTGRPGLLSLNASEILHKSSKRIFIFWQDAVLPDGIAFNNKLYARHNLSTGQGTRLKEVLVEGDLFLGESSVNEKLLYSGRDMQVGQYAKVPGYIKAKQSIHFLGKNIFQSVAARYIRFGTTQGDLPAVAIDTLSEVLPRVVEKRNYQIPRGSRMSSHFVVYGDLTIQADCVITGGIKTRRGLIVGNNVTITGAVISEQDIHFGDHCVIQGPVVSNGKITFGNNCLVGTQDFETSVLAEHIIVGNGCSFSGILLAKVEGRFNQDA